MSGEPVPESAGGTPVAGLILAAGESSRMGRDKALLSYHGHTFLETIVAKLRDAGIQRGVVVLGHHAEIIQQASGIGRAPTDGVEVVINSDYRRGQTSSLQTGLAALQKSAGGKRGTERRPPEAIVLCLVDHPAFDPATVKALLTCFQRTRAPVVIPTHEGRRGHPVLIARPLFDALLALGPGEGANKVIRAWGSKTEQVEVSDPGILVDVDDEAAYHALR